MEKNAQYAPPLSHDRLSCQRKSSSRKISHWINRNYLLGQLSGIRFYLHTSWFVIFAISSMTLALTFNETYSHWSALQCGLAAVTTSLLFFTSLVLHELGHAVVARSRDIPVYSITLFIFGGIAKLGRESDNAATEFKVAIAGPLVSIGLSMLFLVLYGLTVTHFESAATIFETLVLINLVIAAFNMLPGFPLDGGRVLRATIWQITNSRRTAHRWAILCGRGVALSLIGFGLALMFYYMYPVNGLWMIGIGGFILVSGKN